MEHLPEHSTEQLLAYISLSMARLALEAKPEAKAMATEALAHLETVKARVIKSLGSVAVEQ